jgi:chromate transport protein ChrA
MRIIAWIAILIGAVLAVIGFTDPSRVLLIFVGLAVAVVGTIPYTMTRRRRRPW